MKIIKIIAVSFLLFAALTVTASAESNKEEIYKKQYEAGGADKLEENLSEDTKELLKRLEINAEEYSSLKAPDFKEMLEIILECVTEGVKKPLEISASVLGIILLFSLLNTAFSVSDTGGNEIFLVLVIGTVLLSPLTQLISATSAVLKTLAAFLNIFIPVFGGILSASGHINLGTTVSAGFIGAGQLMLQFVSLVLVPSAKAVACLTLCGSMSGISGINNFCKFIKNLILSLFGTVSAIFLSVLSMQTGLAASADSTLLRTSKSVISSLIPVMGPLISETIGTAGGCLGVLRTGIGVYGVLALFLTALPILISLLAYKFFIGFLMGVGHIFDMSRPVSVLNSASFCIDILIGALVFTLLIFIISIGVISKAGV